MLCSWHGPTNYRGLCAQIVSAAVNYQRRTSMSWYHNNTKALVLLWDTTACLTRCCKRLDAAHRRDVAERAWRSKTNGRSSNTRACQHSHDTLYAEQCMLRVVLDGPHVSFVPEQLPMQSFDGWSCQDLDSGPTKDTY